MEVPVSDPTNPSDPYGQESTPPPPPPAGGYGAPASGPLAAAGNPPLAEIGKRGIAALIDFGIIIGGYIALFILAAIFSVIADGLGALVLIVGYLALFGFQIWNFYIVQGS